MSAPNAAKATTPVAVVTGGTSGIGRATVCALADAGHVVAFCGRDPGRVEETVTTLARQGLDVHGYVCDVRRQDEVDRFLDGVVADLGAPCVLVNNAGRGGGGPSAAIDDETWLDVLDTNLTAVFRMTRGFQQRTTTGPGGRIIMIASTGGKQGVPMGAPYSASKAGVIGYAKALAKELAPHGTTVNAVCPGYVETPMAADIRSHYATLMGVDTAEVQRRFEAKIPLGRYSTSEEVAGMVRYLCSPSAASVTAQAVNVCGGLGSF